RLRRGELTRAQEWAGECGVSPDDELAYLREYEHITLARVLLAEAENTSLQRGIGLLHRLETAAAAGGRVGTLIEILVLQALAHQAARDPSAALSALRRAVALAEPAGYARVFADEGEPMAALLKTLVRQEPELGYARRLATIT